jgi:hypothetical protein
VRTLDQLENLKISFSRTSERRVAALLQRLARMRVPDPGELIRLHETVLFLRAYPHSPRVARLADRLLESFAQRLAGLDPEPFEAPEVSGIAGTAVSTAFSYPFARSLAERHGRAISIDWDNYRHPERLGAVLARLVPVSAEDWTVEPHPDWRRWWEALRADVRWLLDRVDPQTYESLEVPLLWRLGESPASRSKARLPRRGLYCHTGPRLARRNVSIDVEFAAPPIAFRRVSPRQARRVIHAIIDASAVRYRELWGFLYPDLHRMEHADLGRGVELYWLGVPPAARLPLRAYHCGMFFKNGVPIGYVETLSLFERCEAGFNLYYTFREGETAWLYVRLLKFCRQRLGVTCFSIDPYQLGHENEEAIASGAFWFYRKLGFAPARPEAIAIMQREERRLAARPGYRTPPRTLRRLAAWPVYYGDGREWADFSLPALGRRIAREKGRDPWASILARAGAAEVSAAEIAAAKNAPDETRYLRLLRNAPRLRRAVLRLGRPETGQ